ncbi:MAG TPA: hypothetical protein VLA41_12485 [Burkholderiales bacterium]|nr:hypothetical protein [Burkholderiales bacterium]
MLNKCVRLLLAAFLIAALPLQGFAALGASICRDLQHSQHEAGHGHAPVTVQAHGHGAHGDVAAAYGDQNGTPSEPATAHCAACASCGLAAGIVAAVALPLSDAIERDVIAHTLPSFLGFVPDGLDRPPLTPLA